MLTWSIEEIKLDLKFNWKISRGESDKKIIYIITVKKDQLFGQGEVAGLTLSERTESLIPQYFEEFKKKSPQNLKEVLEIKLPSHLRLGVSSALTQLQAKEAGQKLYEFLGQKKIKNIPTSFSLPIMDPSDIKDFFNQYNLSRFQSLKVKINQQSGIQAIEKIREFYKSPLRIDANEDFTTHQAALEFITAIKNQNIQFIEQPLPIQLIEESIKLKSKSPLPIFADESLQSQPIDDSITSAFHGVNIKLMKSGSLQNAIDQKAQAKSQGLKTMLGCMVETTLGIQTALNISDGFDYYDLDGFLFFKDEPFNLVTEKNGELNFAD